jgi:cyclopropane fatty-acyl-phospholipid synthase-like methyltransferase
MAAKEMLLRFHLKTSDKNLLDIGGGPGAYTAAYCRRYPDLKAVIFDLPQAVNVGREIVGKYYQDVGARIKFIQGDLVKDSFGAGYDVVFLFNVIHHFSHDENRQTFRKIYEALNPGGTFVILDQLKKSTRADSYLAVLTQLMFLMTSRSESHRLDDVRDWLKEIGFANVRTKDLMIGPGTSFVTATKK